MSNKTNEELGAFPGPGYAGFGGSAGYNGSGAGGVSGGYAGGGYATEPVNTSEGWGPGPDTHHDDRIHDDVQVRLEQASNISANDIQVSVEAGVVTLSGQVATREMKNAAVEIAERVPGVHRVQNQLHIEQPLLDEVREKLAAVGNKIL